MAHLAIVVPTLACYILNDTWDDTMPRSFILNDDRYEWLTSVLRDLERVTEGISHL